MEIYVEQMTMNEEARNACGYTIDSVSRIELGKLAMCEHSPLRAVKFAVYMDDIPSFVSVHFVRHKIGVEHYVKSMRPDRCGNEDPTQTHRLTPINHLMHINAHALIHMARKRLCMNASPETRAVMKEIKKQCPEWLSEWMVPDCVYRGGCFELKTCGKMPRRSYG